ncbi:MFS transporter [Aurantiacibacter poecillastricola]|uniref:MFS transporter n=1 Tax=Aurantiacibacter poecillastricola TaxID=3064385 RepID=UPI00273D3783|nr:MFS transporter [Aurantiacibacter sp. 219JJ12-13]MDP5263029.1 MFS transporter [Aurantiacibacter sp. 219JJ12-13]
MTFSHSTERQESPLILKVLVFGMFAMFAMTTDSVGTVIPEVIREFELGLTAGGSFQYATMSGIGISAIGLGFLADRFGRKATILLGLSMFGLGSALFAAGHDFLFFTTLLFISGLGIGIFKAGALALIGDLSRSTTDHARTMNLIEGFFGVGAIIGPAIVAYLLQVGASWKWVYLVAAIMCGLLFLGTGFARFPKPLKASEEPTRATDAIRLAGDPASVFFGGAIMLYVAAEAAIYVWAPTYIADYNGSWVALAGYLVSIFFILRAAGRFLGVWLLGRFSWPKVITYCSGAMTVLFWIAVLGGREVAVFALPATGLFMSVLYPTINSTGISCFDKGRHGSIAGLLLFFTCVAAVFAPLLMGALGELMGDSRYAIVLGAVFSTMLVLLCAWNMLRAPFLDRLSRRNSADYEMDEATLQARI